MAKLPDLDKELEKLMPKLPKFDTAGTRPKPKRELDVPALQEIAREVGLGKEAQQIVDSKGEEAKEIFSGGVISDIFDGLNALQYGVVGAIKGKGFMEGMRTRQSFSDDDALGQFGIPGWVIGVGLDIAFDPLTYIAPFTRIAKFTGLSNKTQGIVGKTFKKLPGGEKVADWFARKFIWMGGQDPVFKEAWERMSHGIAGDQYKFMDMLKPLAQLDDGARKAIFNARTTGNWGKISQEAKDVAMPLFGEIDKMSRELVETGMLPADVVEKTIGTYLPRLFDVFENPSGQAVRQLANGRKISTQALNRLKKKGDLSPEILEALGEITEAGYPTAKALVQMSEMVHKGRMFKTVRDAGLALDEGMEGLVQLQKSGKLGALSEKFVPKNMAEYLNEMTRVPTGTEKAWRKVVGGFKFGKVVLNPATHARNIMSNFVLNNFEGLNPIEAPLRFWRSYSKAGKAIANRGKDDWYRAFREMGGAGDTYMSSEILDLFKGADGMDAVAKTKGMSKKLWDNTAGRVAKAYQLEEEYAKMAQFIFQAEKMGAKGVDDLGKIIGKSAGGADITLGEEAMKIAERATFNYAQVSPFVRKVRESMFGVPFITFTAKATPQVAKTMLKAPGRVSWIGKVKNAIENMSDLGELKRERKSEPQWIKDGFYVKLPMKDKHGRSAYFDLTYIIPFGDLVSGQILERQVDRETGLPESTAESVLKKAPLINLITEIGKNQDFYGNKIWRASDSQDKQLADLTRHISKTYLPPLVGDMIPGGHITKGRKAGQRRAGVIDRVSQAGEGTQYRTLPQEVLRSVGLKLQPLNVDIQETYANYETKKALETMLEENAAIGTFSRAFRPKK